jgi:hypothetical protein
MPTIILYKFRLKHERTGKWYTARYMMTIQEAKERHGEGNYQLIEGSEEIRHGDDDPMRNSAAHLGGPPRFLSGDGGIVFTRLRVLSDPDRGTLPDAVERRR